MGTYYKISTGLPFSGEFPKTVEVLRSVPVASTANKPKLTVSVVVKKSVGEPGYDSALESFMFSEGYVLISDDKEKAVG